ncbi:MAG: hypothetical protein JNM08_00420 [Rubrivivax sp.]|nr:hypothetical protein [Rubrivivax sp.]
MKHLFATMALVAVSCGAIAQTPSAPQSSPAKKELVARVLKIQQPGIELLARQLVEQPVGQMLQQLGPAMQRVAPERRQALAADIQADARKYADEMNPIVRDKALKLAPTVIGPMLEDRFSEDELKQLIALLESPVNKKFQSMGLDMQRALGEKLIAEIKPQVEPKLKALGQTVSGRMQPASAPASGK